MLESDEPWIWDVQHREPDRMGGKYNADKTIDK
jgi:hypothetical protein